MRFVMLLQSRTTDSEDAEESRNVQPFTLDYRESRRGLDGDLIPRLFISRPLLVDFDVFGVMNPFDEAIELASEEDFDTDDEDCIIPDEYKRLNPEDAAYVLDYLGIRRAKPVQSALHQHIER